MLHCSMMRRDGRHERAGTASHPESLRDAARVGDAPRRRRPRVREERSVADPKAEANDADAGNPELPPVPKNEQFASLNKLRRERTWVDVFLIGGTCLHGQIRSFDASMMLLQTRSGDIGLYHHAIS